jgi:hypothetical protein
MTPFARRAPYWVASAVGLSLLGANVVEHDSLDHRPGYGFPLRCVEVEQRFAQMCALYKTTADGSIVFLEGKEFEDAFEARNGYRPGESGKKLVVNNTGLVADCAFAAAVVFGSFRLTRSVLRSADEPGPATSPAPGQAGPSTADPHHFDPGENSPAAWQALGRLALGVAVGVVVLALLGLAAR